MIALHHLRKSYGAIVAADDVTFDVPNGSVTGLLGPNGAGKTTAFRAIAGLVVPDRGEVRVDDIDVTRDACGARRALGLLPDSPGCYGRLTVSEHVAFCARLSGVARSAVAARVSAALADVDLLARASRRVDTLSMGERRRMRLACATVHQPANLVLDEPTNGLDVLSTRALRRYIRRQADEGRAVLLSSHVMPEVAAVCDRVVVLDKGRVAAAGTPGDLLAQSGAATLEEAFVAVIGSEEGLR